MRQSSTRILNENGGSSVLVCCCKAWQLQLYKDHYYKVSSSQTSNFIFYFTGFPLYQWHICEDFLTAITEHEHTNSVVLISHCIRDSGSSYQKRLSPEYSIIAMDNSKRNACTLKKYTFPHSPGEFGLSNQRSHKSEYWTAHHHHLWCSTKHSLQADGARQLPTLPKIWSLFKFG